MDGFDISTITNAYVGSTPVSAIYMGSTKIWPTNVDYSTQYLTFEAVADTTFTFTTNDVQYSVDDGTTWATLSAGGTTDTISAGSKILWKQSGLTPTSSAGIGTFSATGNFIAYGNVMSLLFEDDFADQVNLTGYTYAFFSLFKANTYLTDASNLILPATTLIGNCYQNMFYGCTSLASAPELPATTAKGSCYRAMFYGCTSLASAPELPVTTLANYCYFQMFYNCSSLASAPELPVTTLANSCYRAMFFGCTSLTTAPELPATTLITYCYNQMFYRCSSLTYIKCLATDISASSCLNNWVLGVASSGTFIKDSSNEDWATGYSGIPSGWTVETA